MAPAKPAPIYAGTEIPLAKLRVGATVRVTSSAAGVGVCEGCVYTVDPVTKTVVLFSSAAKGRASERDVRLIPAHAIRTIYVIADATGDDESALVAALPPVDLRVCAKREADAFEAMELAMAQLNPSASPDGQAMFDALSKTMDCSWVENSINVLDQVRIDAPYGVGDVVSLDGNVDSLARIKKVMMGSMKRMASK